MSAPVYSARSRAELEKLRTLMEEVATNAAAARRWRSIVRTGIAPGSPALDLEVLGPVAAAQLSDIR